MPVLPLIGNALHKSEMEYNGKFGHTLGRIQKIALMSRIEFCYVTCCLENQTVEHNLPGFQGINICVQYLDIHPRKPIFYSSNFYDGSNFIRLKWSGNKVEDYTTQKFLECHQDADNANRRRSFSGILHTMIGLYVSRKVQIKRDTASDSTDGEIRCMYKAVKKTKVIRRYM